MSADSVKVSRTWNRSNSICKSNLGAMFIVRAVGCSRLPVCCVELQLVLLFNPVGAGPSFV